MKILNLYAGIGGNRKLWGDEHDITAIEYKPEIAAVYADLYPNDVVIVADAHEYLLKHFKEFDFIWSSPPCPTHSRARFAGSGSSKEFFSNRQPPIYPDMKLYQEIINALTLAICVKNAIRINLNYIWNTKNGNW